MGDLVFDGRFHPFERTVLEGVYLALPEPTGAKFAAQVRCINKIQRLLDWREIEFYAMRWFKVTWPPELLFDEKGEFSLARVLLDVDRKTQVLDVYSVGGHVFSIESDRPMKPLKGIAASTMSVAVMPTTASDSERSPSRPQS